MINKVVRKIQKCISRIKCILSSEYKYWDDVSKYYYVRTGKKLNWKHPRNIEEKLLWLSYNWQHPLIVQCADKVRMRDYVEHCGLSELLIPIYGVWENADAIDFSALPDSFVIKCNHGSAMNIIVKDKQQIDMDAVRIRLNNWLKITYGVEDYEHHYQYIKPLIYCEQLLPFEGTSVVDYKLNCINGEPYDFFVCTERDEDKNMVTYASYALNWEKTYQMKNEPAEILPPPHNLQEMQRVAKILAKPFPFVRVDFYEVNGRLYIGELTFTPHGNVLEYYRDEYIEKSGMELILPLAKIKGYGM